MMLLLLLCLAQDPKPHPGVDQDEVDRAIDKGMEWLVKQKGEYLPHQKNALKYDDLVVYTLYHGGWDPQQEPFPSMLEAMVKAPLQRTYCVALQAMFLSEFDPGNYQWRLRQCAQFLVDTQAKNGMWSYGQEVPQDGDVPTTGGEPPAPDVATGGGGEETRGRTPKPPPAKRKPGRPVNVKRRFPPYCDAGDNSNSQYAVLGLRACIDANVFPPVDTLKSVKRWFEQCQNTDGGWCYGDKDSAPSYGSMTAGAIGTLAICKSWFREKWEQDPRIANGLKWLIKNWTVTKNPGTKEEFIWLHYYLYAVERAGVLIGREKFGNIDWYKDGANFLLKSQVDDGQWTEGNSPGGPIKDTCFAILFLRRATVPIPKVATGQ